MNQPGETTVDASTPHRPDYGRSGANAMPTLIRRRVWLAVVALLVVAGVSAAWWAEGRGIKTSALRRLFPNNPAYMLKPAVLLVSPAHREGGVMPDALVRAEFSKPNGRGVDPATLKDSVLLLKGNAREPVAARVNTDAVGSVIVLTPDKPLEFNASYTFEVLPALKDTGGAAFEHFVCTFSTAAGNVYTEYPAAGQKQEQPASAGHWYTGVAFGPDGKLYASTLAGQIVRFAVAADGSLSAPQVISTVLANNRGPRLCTGLVFDPASTADHPVVYLAHGVFPFDGPPPQATAKTSTSGTPHALSKKQIPDWSGKLSRLSGANLEKYEDVLVGLPRARYDHTTGQPVFGPDGAIYFGQASNTAMGEPDHEWGLRPERLLTAAVMRLDVAMLAGKPLPVNVQTGEGGTYDPYAAGAPLTLFATGTRNCYDLLFHSNGRFYGTCNGSARGGNTPGTPPDGRSPARRPDAAASGPYDGPLVPTLTGVGTQNDYLFRLERGGYYGHPNPTRAEFVMNGGNPTPGPDACEVAEYPVGVKPDRNWRRPAHDFGKNLSPNGVMEYTGDAFPALKGKILTVRFSGGKDVVALTPDDATGDVRETITGLDGFTHFYDPIDLCQSPATGFLYVAEHTGKTITLVRPVPGGVSHKAVRLDVAPTGTAPAQSPQPIVSNPTGLLGFCQE
jgi:glucose/arabinose dehydrogenase